MSARTWVMVMAAATLAGSAQAQVLGAPALPEGTAREVGFSVTQPEIRHHSTSGKGAIATFRRTGNVNLAGRVAYLGNLDGGLYAEVSTFGGLPLPRIAGVDVRWMTGVGFDTGNGDGLYFPVGLNLSRPFQIRGAVATPFMHGRVSLAHIDPQQQEYGTFTAATEAGVDVGAGTRWSLRAGVAAVHGYRQVVLGVAHRR
jgi:hypothetical protein